MTWRRLLGLFLCVLLGAFCGLIIFGVVDGNRGLAMLYIPAIAVIIAAIVDPLLR